MEAEAAWYLHVQRQQVTEALELLGVNRFELGAIRATWVLNWLKAKCEEAA